jgi:hypothetical protein
VYTKEDTSSIPEFRPKNMMKPDSKLESTEVTEEEVTKCLLRLNASRSPGPDKMHLMIFKRTAEAWAYPLATLYRRIMELGTIPKELKKQMSHQYLKGEQI